MVYELFCIFNMVPFENLSVEFFRKVLMDSIKNKLLAPQQSFPISCFAKERRIHQTDGFRLVGSPK